MELIPVNYLAILSCGVISMVLGTLWYGPLFGKPWMKIMGFSKEKMTEAQKKGMMRAYALMFIGSLVTAYILSNTISLMTFSFVSVESSKIVIGMLNGFWLWLGFVAPVTMGTVLWEGKPWRLWLINNGYNLAFLLISGAILILWK